jgi:beta-D-xylosidase 4
MSLRPFPSDNYILNNPGRTYKFYTGQPTFPFGYGLHYTNFSISLTPPASSTYAISDLLSRNTTAKFKDLIPFITLPISVLNTGTTNTTSSYVALAFLSGSYGPAPYPVKSLVAYTRVHDIKAGEVSAAELKMDLGRLGRVDESGDMVLYPGEYRFVVDIDAKAAWNFTLTGEPTVLESWPEVPVLSGILKV